jgi:small conductance mechanosensitive channel
MTVRVVALLVAQSSVDEVEEVAESATSAWQTFYEALPRVGIALGVLVLAFLLGRLLRPIVRSRLRRHKPPSFARVFAKLTSATITTLGVLLAVTIVFPSVRPVDVLAGAGVLTVAVGFAFQDILQNLLAGILLLFRQPFVGGDQMQVGDVQGTVDEINIRETVVTTFDGRRVLIPNAKVYTDVITVQTARDAIRSNFIVGVDYGVDLQRAIKVAEEAVANVEGVVAEPAPEALYLEMGTSTVNLDVRFWSDAHQLELRRVLSRAIAAVKQAFDEAGIAMPSDIVELVARPSFADVFHSDGGASVTNP